MGTQMNEHGESWEAQRERLSAYLDGRLTPAERAQLEQHLPGCARCSAELAELRQVVALLGAMPAPRLPRSFALPETASRDASPPMPVRASGPSRRSAPAWTQVARWAGGLAAAAGFVLLVGSALAGFGALRGAGASTASSFQHAPSTTHSAAAYPRPTDQSQYGGASPSTAATLPGDDVGQRTQSTASAGVSAGATPPAGATPTAGTQSPREQNNQGAAGTSIPPPELPIAGLGLLAVGAATFTVGSVARRRVARRNV